MSIIEIRELLIDAAQRRRHLGALARRQVDDDWDLSSTPSESAQTERKALQQEP